MFPPFPKDLHTNRSLFTMFQLYALLLPLFASTALAAPASTGVCAQGIYALFQPLATLPAAQSFCAQNLPQTVMTTSTSRKTSTSTSITTTVVSKVLTTTTTSVSTSTSYPPGEPAVKRARHAAPAPEPTALIQDVEARGVVRVVARAAAPAPIPAPTAGPAEAHIEARQAQLAQLLSSLAGLARGLALTACSCIGGAKTTTVSGFLFSFFCSLPYNFPIGLHLSS